MQVHAEILGEHLPVEDVREEPVIPIGEHDGRTSQKGPLGLPVEEAVFFLVTNVLVVQGLLMVSDPSAR